MRASLAVGDLNITDRLGVSPFTQGVLVIGDEVNLRCGSGLQSMEEGVDGTISLTFKLHQFTIVLQGTVDSHTLNLITLVIYIKPGVDLVVYKGPGGFDLKILFAEFIKDIAALSSFPVSSVIFCMVLENSGCIALGSLYPNCASRM